MRYCQDFIIPPNTLEAAPYTAILKLSIGTLTHCQIRFRAGCHNRVNVAVFDSLQQIVPGSPGETMRGDDYIFNIPMNHVLKYKPYQLTLKGWSTGCLFQHNITFWFDLEESTESKKVSLLQALLNQENI